MYVTVKNLSVTIAGGTSTSNKEHGGGPGTKW